MKNYTKKLKKSKMTHFISIISSNKIKIDLRLRGQRPTQGGAGSPRFFNDFFGYSVQALHRFISKLASSKPVERFSKSGRYVDIQKIKFDLEGRFLEKLRHY
ncbi:MAG: hypothetical protein ABGX26_00345, partial [Nautiliaceae bacterium]